MAKVKLAWIEGVIAPCDGQALKAPISGHSCVYYEVWAYGVLSGQQLEKRTCAFLLEKGGEPVLVRTAELELEHEKLPCVTYWTNRGERFEGARAYLARHGIEGRRWYDARVMQLVESRVPLGVTVALWGRLQRVVDADGEETSYRRPPRRPVFSARRLRIDHEP
jgi:hypothetical protein